MRLREATDRASGIRDARGSAGLSAMSDRSGSRASDFLWLYACKMCMSLVYYRCEDQIDSLVIQTKAFSQARLVVTDPRNFILRPRGELPKGLFSMAKRQSISKKLRFEVLKRDSFTCQYCGASAPTIILHIDHILHQRASLQEIRDAVLSASNWTMGG